MSISSVNTPIRRFLVVGSGSAGLLAALALKRKHPQTEVRIVRSPEIGIIGVGEGTTPGMSRFLFDYLGLSKKKFYSMAQPTWKLGIHFLWGPRDHFNYTFAANLDTQWNSLSMPTGFYCDADFSNTSPTSAFMAQGKAFPRQADGSPNFDSAHAFHIENIHLVTMLEAIAWEMGVTIIDGKVTEVEQAEHGVAAVITSEGLRLEADFFIDASGFRSELLGKALQEPFQSFDRQLFCDRAVVGGWKRTDEPILPYTTAETMDSGWAWQIEHEHHINRGYVYSSAFISDADAEAEFRRKNPKLPENLRVVPFRSGRYERSWVGNVVAIGNASGFVEPLEATALMVVCSECQTLCEFLKHCRLSPTEGFRNLFNTTMANIWDEIRDFLALHYQLNTRLETPFWKHCVENTDMSGLTSLLDFYKENGPTGFGRHVLREGKATDFGMEGYLCMLVGNQAPYDKRIATRPDENAAITKIKADYVHEARQAMDVAGALKFVHDPRWRWHE